MAIFQSNNPTLSEKIFSRNIDQTSTEVMTVRGSLNKFAFLLLMVIAGASYTWKLYFSGNPSTMMTLFWIGLIGGGITGFVISFKPNLSAILSPIYGILEGFFLGGISAIINDAVKTKYPNIVLQAVLLTFGVAFAVFLLYKFKIIRPTEKFKSVILSALFGVGLLYLVSFVLGFFGLNMSFLSWKDNSLLGIGFNLFVIVVAALSLVLDFDMLETGEKMGAPKYMEWYGAFGLMVTMILLYIQILQLLSRFASNRS